MTIGAILSGVAVGAVVYSLLRWVRPAAAGRWAIGLAIGGCVAGGVVQALRRESPLAVHRPRQVADDGYVGSASCRSCHTANYDSWHASYHRTMTQVAAPAATPAAFDGREVVVEGRRYRLGSDGDELWVEMDAIRSVPAPDASRRFRYPVGLVTGSHHMQVFWLTTGRGRELVHLPIVYLVDEDRWIPRDAAFIAPTRCSGARYEKLPVQVWNTICIQCHTTHGRPDSQLDTRVAEFGIACEACHGPAADHVAAEHNPLRWITGRADDAATLVNPSRLDHERSSETCGQCHSVHHADTVDRYRRWIDEGFAYRPGDVLEETRFVASPRKADSAVLRAMLERDPGFLDGTFWSDGMVRVSGREYNGLVESPCFQRGEMSCLSCHAMHADTTDPAVLDAWRDDQLETGMRGNAACVQCHPAIGDRLAEHTHHAADSAGSQCANCHMPHTTYGLLKAIRSHQIEVPRAAVALETGRPNACNLCHLDRSLRWTADRLADWYGHERPGPFADGDLETVPAAAVWMLSGDAGQRALVAWGMGWKEARTASGSDWQEPLLAELLDDPYDAVRFIAERTLRGYPAGATLDYDFVGPRPQRAAARRQVLADWGDRPTPPAAGRTVAPEAIERLLRRRDDRPLMLLE